MYLQVNIQPFYYRAIRRYMVDNTITGTPMLVASVAERYECLTSDHEVRWFESSGRYYLGKLKKTYIK